MKDGARKKENKRFMIPQNMKVLIQRKNSWKNRNIWINYKILKIKLKKKKEIRNNLKKENNINIKKIILMEMDMEMVRGVMEILIGTNLIIKTIVTGIVLEGKIEIIKRNKKNRAIMKIIFP